MSQEIATNPSVLIVGAGPCGLAAACALRLRGVDVTVLEAAAEPGTGSRAIMLWPPVLQVLDEIGALPALERQGYRPGALCYHTGRERTIRLPLGADDGALIITQDRTSRVLEERLEQLGGRVERRVRVAAIDNQTRAVIAHAEGPDGAALRFEADWLIGADGARSTVREQLGVAFEGSEFGRTFALAEGQVDGDFERGDAHYFVTPVGVLVVIALPNGEVRVSGALDPGEQISLEAVQRLLDRRGPGNLRLRDPSTLSTYGAPHRVAAAMRVGRCFLVGDAAHVHSPAGGQGLSLGMQDVRNLCWKLAGVIAGELAPAVLDSFELERRAAAQQVVKAIHSLTRQTLFPPIALRLRNAALHLLDRAGRLRDVLLTGFTGRRVRYPDVLLSAAIEPASRRKRRAQAVPEVGLRAPDDVLARARARAGDGDGDGLAGFCLVTLGAESGELARRARERAASALPHVHIVGQVDGFLLLRPDDYVAASGHEPAQLEHALVRYAQILRTPDADADA